MYAQESYFLIMGNNDIRKEDRASIFSFLASLFIEHGVRSVLVGGYALIANNVQRMTFDIDFSITADDFTKIAPGLEAN